MASFKSNFRRAQSKVWWGNADRDNNDPYRFLSNTNNINSHQTTVESDSSSEFHHSSWDDQQRSSPGSLKSQDSGYIDSDHSPNFPIRSATSPNATNKNINRSHPDTKLTPPKKCINNEINSRLLCQQRTTTTTTTTPSSSSICDSSCSSSSDRQTPPTVIRKKINNNFNCTPRRISFSEPNSPVSMRSDPLPLSLEAKINSLNYSSQISPINSTIALNEEDTQMEYRSICAENVPQRSSRLVRSKRVIKRCSQSSPVYQTAEYNNETVYFGIGDTNADNNNNNNSQIDDSPIETQQHLPTYDELYPSETSTPKSNNRKLLRSRIEFNGSLIQPDPQKLFDTMDDVIDLSATMNWDTCTYIEYSNPALNGHAPSVHFWLDELRTSYYHEVMSTLQTKSIARSTVKEINVCSVTSGKIARYLQYKSMQLQNHFDSVEQLIASSEMETFEKKVPAKVVALFESVVEFVNKIRLRNIFRAKNDRESRQFADNLNAIIDLSLELHKTITSQPIDVELSELIEGICVIKRYLMITIQMIFEKLIQIIIDRIEETKCDLILKSNLTMIAMLSNIEYTGFASLNDAFQNTDAIKVLLTICIESKHSDIRTLALRALATVCSSRDLIRQFEQAEGVEIIKDILTNAYHVAARTEHEYREAVSVLTQVTAPWHGRFHIIDGIRLHIESIVESITALLKRTTSSQTVLLCAACLNNLSKMEVTTTFSIMSNETILKLRFACSKRIIEDSIFLYEQITSILLNMAATKKCHSHLANKDIITFITSIFQAQFHRTFVGRAEMDAQRHTIKNILYIFSRLIHESIVGQDILENNLIPVFSRIEQLNDNNDCNASASSICSKDVISVCKRLNDSVMSRSNNSNNSNNNNKNNKNNNTNDNNNNSSSNGSSNGITQQDASVTSTTNNERKLLESYV